MQFAPDAVLAAALAIGDVLFNSERALVYLFRSELSREMQFSQLRKVGNRVKAAT